MNFDWHKKLSFPKLPLEKLPRNFVPAMLILAGALLVGYVLSQYGQMYFEQKRMAEQWDQEQQRRAEQSPTEQAHALKDDGMIRLVIPKIDLTSFVVEGTTHKALLLGPGHLTNTAEPGEAGNAVISGHRDTFFRHIHELEKGDEFYVERGGKKFVYQVTGKRIVEPNDLSVTRPSSDSQLTLITCYPTYYIGPAPKRLVVFSKLENQVDSPLASNSEGAPKTAPHVVTVSVGAH